MERYKIVGCEHPNTLASKVSKLCDEGWYPQGGVFVTCYSNSTGIFYQALTKDIFNLGKKKESV